MTIPRSPPSRSRKRAVGLRARRALTADDLYAAADLDEARAGHPPIGRPEPGDATSARERSGTAGAPEGPEAGALELDLDYQKGFGRVFLACATGRTGERMRDALRERLGDTPERERGIVRDEPGRNSRIRPAGPPRRRRRGPTHMSTDTTAAVSTHVLGTSAGRPAGRRRRPLGPGRGPAGARRLRDRPCGLIGATVLRGGCEARIPADPTRS